MCVCVCVCGERAGGERTGTESVHTLAMQWQRSLCLCVLQCVPTCVRHVSVNVCMLVSSVCLSRCQCVCRLSVSQFHCDCVPGVVYLCVVKNKDLIVFPLNTDYHGET